MTSDDAEMTCDDAGIMTDELKKTGKDLGGTAAHNF